MKKKYRFLRWVIRDLFKVPLGQKPPGYIIWLKYILMPIEAIRARKPFFDFQTGIYTIRGMRYSEDLFNAWAEGGIPVGSLFRLISRKDGYITIEKIFKC